MIKTFSSREELLEYFISVNKLSEAGPLERGIVTEFHEACSYLVDTNPAEKADFKTIMLDGSIDATAFNIVRDICRFVDALKGHKT